MNPKLLKRWSGRWGSNPRRPAWENVTSLCLQHLGVSDALFRLSQVSLYQSFPLRTLLIEVGSRYIVPPRYLVLLHPRLQTTMARVSARAIDPKG